MGGCGRQADDAAGLPPASEMPGAFRHLLSCQQRTPKQFVGDHEDSLISRTSSWNRRTAAGLIAARYSPLPTNIADASCSNVHSEFLQSKRGDHEGRPYGIERVYGRPLWAPRLSHRLVSFQEARWPRYDCGASSSRPRLAGSIPQASTAMICTISSPIISVVTPLMP